MPLFRFASTAPAQRRTPAATIAPMRRLLLRISPVLHLARVTTAFAVVANTWFVILWTRANAMHEAAPAVLLERPLWQLLSAATLVALGLFAFGAALNDILDVRRDRALRPDRPLPAGRITLDAAVALVVGTMLAAILGATAFGTPAVLLTLLMLAAIFLFNVAGRFIPALGLVILGLIYSGHMMIPNVHLRFLWPVWLVMTHALAVGALAHIMANKVPRLSRRAVVAAGTGWLFWTAMILLLQWRRDEAPVAAWPPPLSSLWPEWVSPAAALGPAILAALFVLVAWDKVRRLGPGTRAAEKISRYGALWLALYACAWLLGDNHITAALILGALATAAWLGMTALRELYGLLEQPVGYRR
jgi:4-hydroxybenzoate polyprenyltransferase